MCVQDADRFDALGAIGIVRSFAYYEMLFYLKDLMNTDIEKKLQKLERFVMKDFVSKFLSKRNLKYI